MKRTCSLLSRKPCVRDPHRDHLRDVRMSQLSGAIWANPLYGRAERLRILASIGLDYQSRQNVGLEE